MVYLRNASHGKILNRKGLFSLRRLPAFHSIVDTPSLSYKPQNPLSTTGDYGIAFFAHEEKTVFNASLEKLHSLESSGLFKTCC